MKKGYVKLGKGFIEPFTEPDYYKRVTYEEVFARVRSDINKTWYQWTWRADGLRPISDKDNLTEKLKLIVPSCSDLFESESPDARKLVAHFGKLIWKSHYAQTPQERKEAKDAINEIVGVKTLDAEWSKIYIPTFLSLNDMIEYIHRITKYLKAQLCEDDLSPDMEPDDFIDPRLKDLANKDREYIRILFRTPTKLTHKLVADFFGLTVEGLKAKKKEEKRYLNTYHLNR